MHSRQKTMGSGVMVMAAVIIVLAGVKAAVSIIVPFLLSLFIAIILMPILQFLITRRVPKPLALLLLIAGLVILFSLVGMLVGHALNDFSLHLSEYDASLRQRMGGTFEWLNGMGIHLPKSNIIEVLDPGVLFAYMTGALKGFGSVLTNGLVILLTTVFMMLEGVDFKEKIAYLYAQRASGDKEQLTQIFKKINHYMALKAVMSFATGFIVYIMLVIFGLDYPVLWGVIAFLLNFIPNIGSIIAAVPAVLLAMIQLDLISAFWIAVGYIAINTLVGSIVEPKVMGKGLDLSTLVVFLSLLFWGWLLGPVGMLLSIPLTIMVKIVLDANESTRWAAILLGERVPD